MPIAAIVLAAGQGTRMKSNLPKVLHPVAGAPMICWVIDRLERLKISPIYVVVGYKADAVRDALSEREVICVQQAHQRGTADAVRCTSALSNFKGSVLILNGDTPLLTEATLHGFLNHHAQHHATVTLLTAHLPDPTGYGRILRHAEGELIGIVEEREATETQRAIHEINTGTYLVRAPFLFKAIENLRPHPPSNEFYLTDIVEQASQQKLSLSSVTAPSEEAIGINRRIDLARAERIARDRINAYWMSEGVTLLDPATIRIAAKVKLAEDVVLYPGVTLEGRTQIGARSIIYPGRICDSEIGTDVLIKDYCVIEGAVIAAGASIGPFARIRPESQIDREAQIGNFVEIKKSRIGTASKVNHLSYLGDTEVGKRVNVGAGVITCNYDGVKKHQTVIEDDVFVGSDAQLIAPVRIGKGATIAAGTTLTQDVPSGTLAISRTPQSHKRNWNKKRKTSEP